MKAVNIRRSWIALSWLAVLMGMPLLAGATTYSWTYVGTDNWTATTRWSPNADPNGAGHIAQATAGGVGYTALNGARTVGSLINNGSSCWLWEITDSGYALTLDNTGGSANMFGNNNASIAVTVSGLPGSVSLRVRSAIVIANTDLDIGMASGATAGVQITGAITATSTRNLTFRALSSANAVTVPGSIGASGSNIAISNLGTGAAAVRLQGVLGPSVAGVTQNSGTSTLYIHAANPNYTGVTLVSAGTLELKNVNALQGSTLDTGASGSQSVTFTVAGANTYNLGGLRGSDLLTIGANTVSVTGALSPGSGGPGTLPLSSTGGKLDFATGSSMNFELGTASDLVSFDSAGDWLSGGGNATLNLTLGAGFDYGNTYTLIQNATTTGFTFADITGYDDVAYMATVSKSGDDYVISFALAQPTILLSGAHTVDENLPAGTAVGSFSMIGIDDWTLPITYAFNGGTDDGSFQLSGSGNGDLLTAAVFDKETKDTYSIGVLATDSADPANTAIGTFAITVDDVDEPGGRMYARGEVQVGQTQVGVLEALPGAGDTTVTYAASATTYHGAMFDIQNNDELHLTAAPEAGALGDAYFVDVEATGDVSGSLGSMLIKVTVVNHVSPGTIFLFR